MLSHTYKRVNFLNSFSFPLRKDEMLLCHRVLKNFEKIENLESPPPKREGNVVANDYDEAVEFF